MKFQGNNGHRDFHEWNLEGKRIRGIYLQEVEVIGTVQSSRVKYGGDISHWVVLDTPVHIYFSEEDLHTSLLILDSGDPARNELLEVFDEEVD